jgi:hypothetical protein
MFWRQLTQTRGVYEDRRAARNEAGAEASTSFMQPRHLPNQDDIMNHALKMHLRIVPTYWGRKRGQLQPGTVCSERTVYHRPLRYGAGHPSGKDSATSRPICSTICVALESGGAVKMDMGGVAAMDVEECMG